MGQPGRLHRVVDGGRLGQVDEGQVGLIADLVEVRVDGEVGRLYDLAARGDHLDGGGQLVDAVGGHDRRAGADQAAGAEEDALRPQVDQVRVGEVAIEDLAERNL